eukprot:GSA25T00010579001.1
MKTWVMKPALVDPTQKRTLVLKTHQSCARQAGFCSFSADGNKERAKAAVLRLRAHLNEVSKTTCEKTTTTSRTSKVQLNIGDSSTSTTSRAPVSSTSTRATIAETMAILDHCAVHLEDCTVQGISMAVSAVVSAYAKLVGVEEQRELIRAFISKAESILEMRYKEYYAAVKMSLNYSSRAEQGLDYVPAHLFNEQDISSLSHAFSRIPDEGIVYSKFWETVIHYLSDDVPALDTFFRPQGLAVTLNALARMTPETTTSSSTCPNVNVVSPSTCSSQQQHYNNESRSSYNQFYSTSTAGAQRPFDMNLKLQRRLEVAISAQAKDFSRGQLAMVCNAYAKLGLDPANFFSEGSPVLNRLCRPVAHDENRGKDINEKLHHQEQEGGLKPQHTTISTTNTTDCTIVPHLPQGREDQNRVRVSDAIFDRVFRSDNRDFRSVSVVLNACCKILSCVSSGGDSVRPSCTKNGHFDIMVSTSDSSSPSTTSKNDHDTSSGSSTTSSSNRFQARMVEWLQSYVPLIDVQRESEQNVSLFLNALARLQITKICSTPSCIPAAPCPPGGRNRIGKYNMITAEKNSRSSRGTSLEDTDYSNTTSTSTFSFTITQGHSAVALALSRLHAYGDLFRGFQGIFTDEKPCAWNFNEVQHAVNFAFAICMASACAPSGSSRNKLAENVMGLVLQKTSSRGERGGGETTIRKVTSMSTLLRHTLHGAILGQQARVFTGTALATQAKCQLLACFMATRLLSSDVEDGGSFEGYLQGLRMNRLRAIRDLVDEGPVDPPSSSRFQTEVESEIQNIMKTQPTPSGFAGNTSSTGEEKLVARKPLLLLREARASLYSIDLLLYRPLQLLSLRQMNTHAALSSTENSGREVDADLSPDSRHVVINLMNNAQQQVLSNAFLCATSPS